MTRILLLITMILTLGVNPALANDDGQNLVDKSTATINTLLKNENFQDAHNLLQKARAVLVIPNLVKAGFIIGAETGDGVLVAKTGNGWSEPAFYRLAAGSIGLQAGVNASEVMFIIMNDKALNAILDSHFKFGADASVAVGTVGGGIEASTTTEMGKDIYAFSNSVGLFGGGAFEGAALSALDRVSEAYYGSAMTAKTILSKEGLSEKTSALRKALP